MINGKKTKYFDITNLLLSLTIQDPQNKFIVKKCAQKIIKKASFSNNSAKLYKPKYRLKFSKKS